MNDGAGDDHEEQESELLSLMPTDWARSPSSQVQMEKRHKHCEQYTAIFGLSCAASRPTTTHNHDDPLLVFGALPLSGVCTPGLSGSARSRLSGLLTDLTLQAISNEVIKVTVSHRSTYFGSLAPPSHLMRSCVAHIAHITKSGASTPLISIGEDTSAISSHRVDIFCYQLHSYATISDIIAGLRR